MTIIVYTENKYLFQKIKHDAPPDVDVILSSFENNSASGASLILWDLSLGECPFDTAMTLGRKDNADISIPFPLGTIRALLSDETERKLLIDKQTKSAILHGAPIKLTDVEFALFSILYEKEGGYVSREALLSSVWGGECESGILNVYIHYLREKLEVGGEKIIRSSRKFGYCIDKRFFGGMIDA